MDNNQEIANIIISTINTIFENLFSSIDNNLYKILDELVFINKNILKDKYFSQLFGINSTSGILLVANSLIIGIIIFYAAKFIFSNFTYERIENPIQFIFKCIIFVICMNGAFFILEQILDLNFNICELIRSIGQDQFGKTISFSELIKDINTSLGNNEKNILNVFTIEGMIKGTLTIALLNLVFSYSLRYVMIKILALIAPFAFLSLSMQKTSHFFKSWYKSFISLLFVQIFVSIILLILFSIDYTNGNLIDKFIYIGGIYSLIRANSTVRELFGGISTSVQTGLKNLNLGIGSK